MLRRYRIGEAIPAVLIGAALPFHATHAFVRLARVCALEGTPWAWLGPALAAGSPLPRPALVARAAADPAALAAVAALAEPAAGLLPAPGHLAFAAVTVCEALGAASSSGGGKGGARGGGGLSEATLRAVLPSVLGGLAPKAGPDRRAAALMVAAALAARASLSLDLVQGETQGGERMGRERGWRRGFPAADDKKKKHRVPEACPSFGGGHRR